MKMTFYKQNFKNIITSSLTAFNRYRSCLQRKDFSIGLWDVYTKHKSNSSILSANISFSFSKFYIWISEFQNTSTINTRGKKNTSIISLLKSVVPNNSAKQLLLTRQAQLSQPKIRSKKKDMTAIFCYLN